LRRALLFALCVLACSVKAPPYGLRTFPEQRWRFEADETTEIDGTRVSIVRAADFVLRAQPKSGQDTPLDLYVDRYRIRVEGAPGGSSELQVSEQGLTATTAEGPVSLGADDKTPGGDTVKELRARPVSSVELDARGIATHAVWSSPHPVWAGVSLLDWWLLALPPEGPGEVDRRLPQIGQYDLDLELDMRWHEGPEARTHHGDTRAHSDSLHLASGFEGRADVQVHSDAEYLPDGRVREARLRLALDFTATNGTHVQSSHTIRWTCSDCGAGVNPPGPGPDTGRGRDGTPQQGHLDDLPDHGGVRRGL
jgi:hypothetical protein